MVSTGLFTINVKHLYSDVLALFEGVHNFDRLLEGRVQVVSDVLSLSDLGLVEVNFDLRVGLAHHSIHVSEVSASEQQLDLLAFFALVKVWLVEHFYN